MTRAGDFTLATKRIIAERAGFVCAFSNCMASTSGPSLETSKSVNVGEAAHITAASRNGPRYDDEISDEERASADNGIWMCRTHAALIDRDVSHYTKETLVEWKDLAEGRALKLLGRPRGFVEGSIASCSQAARFGAENAVLVDGMPVPFAPRFDIDGGEERLTWFVSAFVLQFSVQKKHHIANAIVEQFIVTVHESKPVPEYQVLYGVYPAEVSLFYVEIDSTAKSLNREFTATRFYRLPVEGHDEVSEFPSPVVLYDNIPSFIAIRLNARTDGMYLISLDAILIAGELRERINIMSQQWVIFEGPEIFLD